MLQPDSDFCSNCGHWLDGNARWFDYVSLTELRTLPFAEYYPSWAKIAGEARLALVEALTQWLEE